MALKGYSDEDILRLLREIEVSLAGGMDVASACRTAGVSDASYYTWRKKYGGMGKSQLKEMKSLEKENARLKRIVADLELDKLILNVGPPSVSNYLTTDTCIPSGPLRQFRLFC